MAQAHNEQIRAMVLAELAAGEPPSIVSKRHGIPVPTIKSWRLRQKTIVDTPDASDASTKKLRIATLVVEHLESNLEALQKLTQAIQDDDWLYKQSAGDVAILFGVVSDKTYRLLEAMVSSEAAEE